MIGCSSISKTYNGTTVIKDISLTIRPGEITVLIGPSGSGKTTLLKMLSLIENPSSGNISIDGTPYHFPAKRPIRQQFHFAGSQQIGVVFQNLHLIPHWTNRENIFKPIGRHPWPATRFKELVHLLHLEPFLDKFPHQCSRGEQQRIAFVRAIMLNPKYLFLDEITSALDPELIAAVFKYLIELKNNGMAVFLITHFLLFAQHVADKIIFLQHGDIIEQGSNEIMEQPATARLRHFLNSLEGIIINPKVPNAYE